MSADRDLRVARLALRLHVGEDGDPLDNDILAAFEALPDSTIIRNDWIRRRLVIGHLLEREGISGLLAAIGGLSGGAVAAPERPRAAPERVDEPEPVPAGYQAPEFHDGPAAEIGQRVGAPAPKEASSAKKKMFGLMPVISIPDPDHADVAEDAGVDSNGRSADESAIDQTVAPACVDHPDETAEAARFGQPSSELTSVQGVSPESAVVAPEQATPTAEALSAPEEPQLKPRVRIEPVQQPVIRIPTADQPAMLADQQSVPADKEPVLADKEPVLADRQPVATNPVDDTRAMLERFAVTGDQTDGGATEADFNPVLESEFQN